jgi:hypothetical protein
MGPKKRAPYLNLQSTLKLFISQQLQIVTKHGTPEARRRLKTPLLRGAMRFSAQSEIFLYPVLASEHPKQDPRNLEFQQNFGREAEIRPIIFPRGAQSCKEDALP